LERESVDERRHKSTFKGKKTLTSQKKKEFNNYKKILGTSKNEEQGRIYKEGKATVHW